MSGGWIDDHTYEEDTDPVNDYATGPVVSGRPPDGWLRDVVSAAQAEVASWPEWKKPVAFANPESCTLGPVRVTEVLEVLKPFAEDAGCYTDRCSDEDYAYSPLRCFRAAHALYLKLGGKL